MHPVSRDVLLSTALSTSIPQTSKGFQMLSRLGYKPGSTLGATGNKNGVLEPVVVEMKGGREGLGMANERKRKYREETEEKEHGEKVEAEGYRERVSREREAKRMEGLVGGAMRILEDLEEQREGTAEEKRRVNVLYRGLVYQRRKEERERRARYDLTQSLSRDITSIGETDEDKQDRLAWGTEVEDLEEEKDEELEAYEALESGEKLNRLVAELRDRFGYCFWCKCGYSDKDMEGCPGAMEDDHD